VWLTTPLGELVRILIDLQPLQTPAAATRGVGKYTNGLLSALSSSHDVIGARRNRPFLVAPSVDVPTVEIDVGSDIEPYQQLSDWIPDAVINCSGPFWDENVIISSRRGDATVVASIFYDAVPWVFPDIYLRDSQTRLGYHNRCVDLYARADLVCAISENSKLDALRFGYATQDSATNISLGVEPLAPEELHAWERWQLGTPYLLSVSGDEYRKRPESLIAAYLQSEIRKAYSLVVVISNDRNTGFSHRMEAKYGALRPQGIVILPEVTDSELAALYRDCQAFVFSSLYEGFGIPIVEAMQFGKWIVSSRTSSLAEVCGPALLSAIEDPTDTASVVHALHEAQHILNREPPEPMVPRAQAQRFTWKQVVRNFEDAIAQRRNWKSTERDVRQRPKLFWASPFPMDESGISFYSEDLLGFVSEYYDIILVPNTISTFAPTAKTGQFKATKASAESVLSMANGEVPLVFYNIGNSHFHLNLLELLFSIPGVTLLHDSVIAGLESLWRKSPRNALTKGRGGETTASKSSEARRRFDQRPLVTQIIESSLHVLFLGDHAASLIAQETLLKRPRNIVPLYCRYRGAIPLEKKAELRLKHCVPPDAFVITTIGFQTRMKLTDEIVRSCLELQHWEREANVYIQVLGHFFDTALEAEVRALLSENKVGAFVSSGFVDDKCLEERLGLSDISVFLRKFSTGGPSAGLNDALGMGIPSLVTDDFAFREYPATAVLRVPNSEITEGMILLYRHPSVREALALGALRYAQEMSLERVAGRLCEIFSLYELAGLTRSSIRKPMAVGYSPGRVFVDITFSLMNNLRSGLQRVEREIASGLREIDVGSQWFSFVAWNRDTRQFHLIPLDQLLRREALPPLHNWLAAYPVAKFDDKVELFVLGSNWPLGKSYYKDLVTLSRKHVRLSVLIPDLIPIRHRWDFYGHYPAGATFDLFNVFCRTVLPVCSNVLTISNYVRKDLEQLLVEINAGPSDEKNSPKLHVLKLGAEWTAPIENGLDALVGIIHQIPNAYVLCVSTLEKRKNHWRLFEAMKAVRACGHSLDLVLVGGVDVSIDKNTLQFITEQEWVHHYDRVDDFTLRQLYEKSLFTVYPSLDEGYGLPVIESLRYGKFCLASDAGAIPEAGGNWVDYFDPRDIQALTAKILEYVSDSEQLRRREAALRSYNPTSWRETAWQVACVFYGEAAKDIFIAESKKGAKVPDSAHAGSWRQTLLEMGQQQSVLEAAASEVGQQSQIMFQADRHGQVYKVYIDEIQKELSAVREWRHVGLLRVPTMRVLSSLLYSDISRRLGARILAPFPLLEARVRQCLRTINRYQDPGWGRPELSDPNVVSSRVCGTFDVARRVEQIRRRLVEELDRVVYTRERKCLDPLESALLDAGLYSDSTTYSVNAFHRIPESIFLEALSVLLFKVPLEQHRFLNALKKISRRRLVLLGICSVLPGRRARITGLYREIVRNVLARSPGLFSLTKRLYRIP
jgi:glycosyltransferase involved in cell wall biosynthesis